MTQDTSGFADFRRQLDEIQVLVTTARRRYEAGEQFNLSELQARTDRIRRMASQPGLREASAKASLRSALEATVRDLDALSELVSANRANLLRRITDIEKAAGPDNASPLPNAGPQAGQ